MIEEKEVIINRGQSNDRFDKTDNRDRFCS